MNSSKFGNAELVSMSILIVLASPLVLFQATTLGVIFVTTQSMKIVVALILSRQLIVTMAINSATSFSWFMAGLGLIFLGYNFTTIVLFSAPSVGLDNAVKAFLYNYSLLIFLLPYYWLCRLPERLSWSSLAGRSLKYFAIAFVFFADIYGIAEFVRNDYLLAPDTIDVLVAGDNIKFDHIGDFIRVSSFFKSPLEFGIFNVFVSGFLLSKILSGRNSKSYSFLLLFSSICVFATVSRTAMVMYFFNLLFLSWLQLTTKSLRLAAFRVVVIPVILLALLIVAMSQMTSIQDYLATSTNLTNSQIRIENWRGLLSSLIANIFTLLFGFGIVQNGSFGEYHSVIIDNIFVGILMTGGMVGLLLFTTNFYLILRDARRRIRFLPDSIKPVSYSLLSFALCFIAGGMSENLMHLMYYPFIALFFIKAQPIPIKSSYYMLKDEK